jgi:hypothetical protein
MRIAASNGHRQRRLDFILSVMGANKAKSVPIKRENSENNLPAPNVVKTDILHPSG